VSEPPEVIPVPVDAAELAQQSFADWNSGNQVAALERLQPRADQGEPWALGLLCFFYQQQGPSGMNPGLPYARRASSLGMPWVAYNFFNNLMAHLPSQPDLLEPALELATTGSMYMWGPIDPVGQGWNLLSQGHAQAAVRLMNIQVWAPVTPEGWESLVTTARGHLAAIASDVETAHNSRDNVTSVSNASVQAIGEIEADFKTKADQLDLLLDTTSASAVNALFEKEAETNKKESDTAWKRGIWVLIAAAVVAILPLALHYIHLGPDYSNKSLLLAHAGSTAALGTVAGVVLARARSRDLARQRAKDLSTAMGTMIVYSNRIQDPTEKQQFIKTMGQAILESHIHTSTGSKDESMAGLAALISAIRGQS
jgi:hypothetical protein